MSSIAQIMERAIELAEFQPSRSTPASPEAVALAALVSGRIQDPTLSARAAEADSLEEILDCVAADRLIMRTELPIKPVVLYGAKKCDLVRVVLDRILRADRASRVSGRG